MTPGGLAAEPLSTFVVLAVLSLVPFVFMTATSFAKISIVFSILRSALGLSNVPSGAIITALSLMLSLYVMTPVGEAMWALAAPRFTSGATDASLVEVATQAKAPLIEFLHRNARPRERELFVRLAREARAAQPDSVTERDFGVVLPAFLITELTEAFQIGFLVFLPFLILDLVIANVLVALGMTMLSPTQVSVPFKLLLFVAVDGWYVLSKALIAGYR
jgi:type III secretion protein R